MAPKTAKAKKTQGNANIKTVGKEDSIEEELISSNLPDVIANIKETVTTTKWGKKNTENEGPNVKRGRGKKTSSLEVTPEDLPITKEDKVALKNSTNKNKLNSPDDKFIQTNGNTVQKGKKRGRQLEESNFEDLPEPVVKTQKKTTGRGKKVQKTVSTDTDKESSKEKSVEPEEKIAEKKGKTKNIVENFNREVAQGLQEENDKNLVKNNTEKVSSDKKKSTIKAKAPAKKSAKKNLRKASTDKEKLENDQVSENGAEIKEAVTTKEKKSAQNKKAEAQQPNDLKQELLGENKNEAPTKGRGRNKSQLNAATPLNGAGDSITQADIKEEDVKPAPKGKKRGPNKKAPIVEPETIKLDEIKTEKEDSDTNKEVPEKLSKTKAQKKVIIKDGQEKSKEHISEVKEESKDEPARSVKGITESKPNKSGEQKRATKQGKTTAASAKERKKQVDVKHNDQEMETEDNKEVPDKFTKNKAQKKVTIKKGKEETKEHVSEVKEESKDEPAESKPNESEEQKSDMKQGKTKAAAAKERKKRVDVKHDDQEMDSEEVSKKTPNTKAGGDKGSAKGKRKQESKEQSSDEKEEVPASKKRKGSADKGKDKAPAKNTSSTSYDDLDLSNSSMTEKGKPWNLKIASWNVSGIRAWLKKGGLDYIKHEKPDILCLQEIKCSQDKLPEEVTSIPGYHPYWLCNGETAGYAGVGIYTTKMAINVKYGLQDEELDKDGRIITAEYEHFYLINTYVPNAGRGLVTLPLRLKWNEAFHKYVKELDAIKPVIICGDMNVAHNEIDLANPKTNKKNAGFTPEEREGMTTLLNDGFVDTFRKLYPNQTGAYTFWTYMANARAKNVGWRLDYFIVSERLLPAVCDHVIRDKVYGSDHCPLALLLFFNSVAKPSESP